MNLPKISYPTFAVEVPSTKKKYAFRPFLVKEEKILLMAKASEQESDILVAIKQVVNNCCLDDKFDVDHLTLFDLEYVFIKIRSQSVSNIVQVSYRDNEDNKVYDFDIDLDDIKVTFPENVEDVVKIDENSGIKLKYPEASIYEDKEFLSSGNDAFFQLIIRCLDKIYEGDEIYDCKNYSHKDLSEYLESLDVKTFEKIREFMVNQPQLNYKIVYNNSLGNARTVELTSLSDFFTLR